MASDTKLPRRGDEDRRECTDCPVFLVQRRRLVLTSDAVEYNHDLEAYYEDVDWDESESSVPLSEEEIVGMELGRWEWDTQRVMWTREAAQAWADAKAHRGPWRVYSVPAAGELRTLLRAQTDYEAQDVESDETGAS